ncbi:uncharacterized protein LOC100373699 [Saccoglossus kowalevskii]|uniref:Uncharacterized protein LOC100373699 n=1 Tax=Saccoglossus kowalevskii TaxID=10224 RepID=A0ABM0GJT4_SACKO|nr:PREDICTED: uncharacterized protein LOC100373699 [Saccoglossus kowalevskii]
MRLCSICKLLSAFLLSHCISGISANWQYECASNTDCTTEIPGRSLPCSIYTQRAGDTGLCSNLPVFSREYETPPPDLKLEDVTISMTIDTYTGYGDFPGLNVSVALPLALPGDEYMEGVQIILRGMTDNEILYYTYYNREICRVLNFQEADMERHDGDPERVHIYYDCLKPLSPGSRYEIQVNLVPYSIHGRPVSFVKTEFTLPSCEEYPRFHECYANSIKHSAAMWGPYVFDVYATGRYKNDIGVVIDLPPTEYELDAFRLLLYRKYHDKWIFIEYNNIIQKHEILYIQEEVPSATGELLTLFNKTVFRDLLAGEYILKLRPVPSNVEACGFANTNDCKVTVSSPINVTDVTKNSVESGVTVVQEAENSPKQHVTDLPIKTRKRNKNRSERKGKNRNGRKNRKGRGKDRDGRKGRRGQRKKNA